MTSLPLRDSYIGFQTLVLKEVNRVLRIWVQTIVPPAIQMTLYFIIFGSLIGHRIGEMGGYSYMEYLAPGLIMNSVVMNSYTNSVSSFFGAKFGRHIEELLVSPLPNVLILLGYVAGSVCRGLLIGILVAIIATLFTHLPLTHPFVMVTVVILCSMVFALAGLINAIFAQKFDDVTIIPTFVLTPLIYLGGVFYSIDLLAPTWRMLSKIDPILYMVNAFRYGFLGVSDISIGIAYGIICTFLVVLFSVALYLLNKGTGLRS
ncbi:MAG TPA: ABC transporter permease [Gammaproteobacteria bacterium]|nr:ABC transporter permease [Gammaproteobacteria bacterium]